MNGSSRAAAGGAFIELDGKKYFTTQMDTNDYATVERAIIDKKINPFDFVTPLEGKVTKQTFDRLMDKAYEDAKRQQFTTPEEIEEFAGTIDGMILFAFLQTRRNYPDITVEFIKEALNKQIENSGALDESLTKVISDNSGAGDLGNTTGPDSSEPDLAQRASGSTGDTSCVTSQKNTDSPPNKSEG